MEKPSTGVREYTETLTSDAQAAEKTLSVTQLYEEYRPRIYSHTYRLLGNRQDADDVTQEVFVAAYLTWDRLSAREKLSGWLYRIATIYALICYGSASVSPIGSMKMPMV
jgi:DNA-directed RNA polymerase specialized sigma24 family protein